MGKQSSEKPYSLLGGQLKKLRTRANESLAEASGAVEIDARELASFELGKSRPSEDVLLLLISHFAARDEEAVRMWETAGYGMDKIPAAHMTNESSGVTVPAEQKVMYTDVVDVMVNNYGVVINFMQSSGPTKPATTIAKVGMSRDHAKSVVQILQATIAQTEVAKANLQNHQEQNKN